MIKKKKSKKNTSNSIKKHQNFKIKIQKQMPKNYIDISKIYSFKFWRKESKNQKIITILPKNSNYASKKKTKHTKIKTNPSITHKLPKKSTIGKMILLGLLLLVQIFYIYLKSNNYDKYNKNFDNDVEWEIDLIDTSCLKLYGYIASYMRYLIYFIEVATMAWQIFFVFTLLCLCYNFIIDKNFSNFLFCSWKTWKSKRMKILLYITMSFSFILCNGSFEVSIGINYLENRLLDDEEEKIAEMCFQEFITKTGYILKKVNEIQKTFENIGNNDKKKKALMDKCNNERGEYSILKKVRKKQAEYLCIRELMITEVEIAINTDVINEFCMSNFPNAEFDVSKIMDEYAQYLCIQDLINKSISAEEIKGEKIYVNEERCKNFEISEIETKYQQYERCWKKYEEDMLNKKDLDFYLGKNTSCSVFSKIITKKYKDYLDQTFKDENKIEKIKKELLSIKIFFISVVYLIAVGLCAIYANTGPLIWNLLAIGSGVSTMIFSALSASWNFKKSNDVLIKEDFIVIRTKEYFRSWRVKIFHTSLSTIIYNNFSWFLGIQFLLMVVGLFITFSFQFKGTLVRYDGTNDLMSQQAILANKISLVGLTVAILVTDRSYIFKVLKFRWFTNMKIKNIHGFGAKTFFIFFLILQLIPVNHFFYGTKLEKLQSTVVSISSVGISFILIKWYLKRFAPYQWYAILGLIFNMLVWGNWNAGINDGE